MPANHVIPLLTGESMMAVLGLMGSLKLLLGTRNDDKNVAVECCESW